MADLVKFQYRNGPGALENLLWVNENPNPATICPCCRPMIGSVWTPGTAPNVPVHPNCYCLLVPTNQTPTDPPNPLTFTQPAWAAWVRYTAYLLRSEQELVPWLEPFVDEAEAYNRKREEEEESMHQTTPQLSVVPSGLIRLSPVDRSADRRSLPL